jgi:hypothetical protein
VELRREPGDAKARDSRNPACRIERDLNQKELTTMGTTDPVLLTPADERRALAQATVPEQIPSLMATISGAAPFLIEEFLCFAGDSWVIFIGYPLGTRFSAVHCDELVAGVLEHYHPEYLWFIGPEIPPSLARSCSVRRSDHYLRLDLAHTKINPSLQREVNQAARALTIERARTFTPEHQSLVNELMDREELPLMIAALYRAMPDYVGHNDTAYTMNARDAQGRLTAFFVVDIAAIQFDTYLLGCHSKEHYAPHASDLLFAEMIAFARERGKPDINLGLGVNEGIQRFKMKWGGRPYLAYEFCECHYGLPRPLSILDRLLRMIT